MNNGLLLAHCLPLESHVPCEPNSPIVGIPASSCLRLVSSFPFLAVHHVLSSVGAPIEVQLELEDDWGRAKPPSGLGRAEFVGEFPGVLGFLQADAQRLAERLDADDLLVLEVHAERGEQALHLGRFLGVAGEFLAGAVGGVVEGVVVVHGRLQCQGLSEHIKRYNRS